MVGSGQQRRIAEVYAERLCCAMNAGGKAADKALRQYHDGEWIEREPTLEERMRGFPPIDAPEYVRTPRARRSQGLGPAGNREEETQCLV